MATPRVSLIVTCHDLGAFLPETLASIRAQTLTDYEVCVVDDGSTDAATLAVLNELPAAVAVVRSENRGLSAARNLGVRHTSGDYICAVDADDLLAPTLLEKSVQVLDADPSLAFVSHWLRAFGDESWEWCPQRCDFPTLLDMNTVNGSALVRRSAVQAVGGWDEDMRDGCEDWEFWIRIVDSGFAGEIIPEFLFEYRRRAGSMSRLKFAGDGLARVYRDIVRKHAPLFRTYLPQLAARREVDTAGHRAACDALEEQVELQLLPAVLRARDDLADVRRQVEQLDQQRAIQDDLAQLRATVEMQSRENVDLMQRLETLGSSLEQSDERLRTVVADHQSLHQELASVTNAHSRAVRAIDEIRLSWSWRVTLPLRVFGGWLLRLAGGRRE